MPITPTVSRILLALAGAATAAASLPVLDLRSGLSLLGAFMTGVAAYNINGKVTAP